MTTDFQTNWQPDVKDLTGWPEIGKPEIVDTDLPAFPMQLLPPRLGEMAAQTARSIQAPLDIAGMIAIPVAGSTLAGKVRFVGRENHCEHGMLWTMCIACSSDRKTPVFERLRQPLVELAKELSEEAVATDEIRKTHLNMVETQIEELKKEATKAAVSSGKASITDKAQAELRSLISERRLLEKPAVGLTEWSTSPTPEGLQRVMAGNVGRAAVFTDEGGIIGTLAGRYSGKEGADMDPFLSGFAGSPLRSPRAGSDRPFVDAAYLTMGLAVQPSVLDDLAAIKDVAERGLIARFLFAVSTTMVGTRMYGDSQPIDQRVSDEYSEALKDWARWTGDPDNLVHIRLDPQAYRTYEKFHDDIEIRQGEGKDLHNKFAVSKISGTTLRLAGLFHCFDNGRQQALRTSISDDATMRAIELTNGYFIPHALAVSDRMSVSGPQGVEARILAVLRQEKVSQFKLRFLSRKLVNAKKGTVRSSADLLDPLEALVDDGYLRRVENTRSPEFLVNPRLFEVTP